MSKIYIASKTKHAARWRELRDKQQYKISSTWIDNVGTVGLAEICIKEVLESDCLVLYCEDGEYLKGAFIEVGAALAAGIPVYVVGEALPLSSAFRQHPLWFQFDSIYHALDYAGGMLRGENYE
jgi:hypothetical protein